MTRTVDTDRSPRASALLSLLVAAACTAVGCGAPGPDGQVDSPPGSYADGEPEAGSDDPSAPTGRAQRLESEQGSGGRTSGGQGDGGSVDAPLGCSPGFAECDGSCVDLSNDPGQCGACGAACGDGEACIEGACAVACAPGLSACGDACVDMMTDMDNCGMCTGSCEPAQLCVDGACVMKSDWLEEP